MGDFRMPSLGADMTEGILLEWHVKPGDEVARGDIVAVVDTSKAEIEVEIFESGVIEELLVPEGTKVPVGTVLARVGPVGAEPRPAAPEPAVVAPTAPAPASEPAPAPQPVAETQPVATSRPAHASAPAGRLRVSPIARRVAAELGVDLGACEGTGADGAITKRDVERAAQPPARVAAPVPPSAPLPAPASRRAGGIARGEQGGGDAPHDREAHGALEARDPPLLPRPAHRHDPLTRLARGNERDAQARRAPAALPPCFSRPSRSPAASTPP